MKLYRFPLLVGLFNTLTFIFIEIMLTGYRFDIHSFNMLSILGIIIASINSICLYYAAKKKINYIVIISLIFAIIFGIYLTFSIYAITYRILMIIDGLIILMLSIKKE